MYLIVLHLTRTTEEVWDGLVDFERDELALENGRKFVALRYEDWVIVEVDDERAVRIRLMIPEVDLYNVNALPPLVGSLYRSAKHRKTNGTPSQV